VCISIEHEDEAKATRPMMNIVDVWRLKYDTVPSSLSVADAPGTKIRLDRSCANLGLGRAPLRGPEAKSGIARARPAEAEKAYHCTPTSPICAPSNL